jgi:hypothetical protein
MDTVGSPETQIPVHLSNPYCQLHEGFYVENNGHTGKQVLYLIIGQFSILQF